MQADRRGSTWWSRVRAWLRGLLTLSPAPICHECSVRLLTREHARQAGWRRSCGGDGIERWTCSRCQRRPRGKGKR